MNRKTTGFTLLEVVASLSLCGLITLGGVMLLDQLNDGSGRIVHDATRVATIGNGDRALRRFLADAIPTVDSLKRFRGDERSVTFLTRCDAPSGWAEECSVALSIDSLRDSSVLMVETSRGERLALRRLGGAAAFRFLDPLAQDSTWRRSWSPSISLPIAMALIAASDTIVLSVGAERD